MSIVVQCDTCGALMRPSLQRETLRPSMRVPWVEISPRLHVCSARCLSRGIRSLGVGVKHSNPGPPRVGEAEERSPVEDDGSDDDPA